MLPVNICSIVPAVVQKAGFEPEYVDINMNDLCADEESIIQKIGKNPQQYSGIIYNYTYGITTNKEAFFNLIKANITYGLSKTSVLVTLTCLIPKLLT